MSAVLEYPRPHVVTVDEFLRMDEGGVFDPEANLELIEGEIIDMAPVSPPHAGPVNVLAKSFLKQAGEDGFVWVRSPVRLGEQSMPRPDLAIVAPREDNYRIRHPVPADIRLAVEVSDSTLAFDLTRKAPLYARFGITELWIADVNTGELVVHREPSARGYATTFPASGEDEVSCSALPQVRVSPRQLFRE